MCGENECHLLRLINKEHAHVQSGRICFGEATCSPCLIKQIMVNSSETEAERENGGVGTVKASLKKTLGPILTLSIYATGNQAEHLPLLD